MKLDILSPFIKKWWFWLVILIAIILAWQIFSGWAYSSKLYKMALDNFRQDQTEIIQRKNEWIAVCEKEIVDMQKKIEQIQKEKSKIQGEVVKLNQEKEILTGRIYDLEQRRQAIIISNDPDTIIDDLRKLGFKSIRIVR